GSYSARKLGLQTTANAGGVHSLEVSTNAGDLDAMLRGMGRGLLVTELMGQGVNTITGDYSRGAAGFWIEDGAISHAVDGITIAGNLKAIFQAIEAVGSDVDPRSHVGTGSILVGQMTVAGGQSSGGQQSQPFARAARGGAVAMAGARARTGGSGRGLPQAGAGKPATRNQLAPGSFRRRLTYPHGSPALPAGATTGND